MPTEALPLKPSICDKLILLYICSPELKPFGLCNFMSENNIVNPNAEVQELTASAEATATTNEPVPAALEQPVGAHDDFDWSIDKRNVTAYTSEEKEKYDKVYDNTFVSLSDGEL